MIFFFFRMGRTLFHTFLKIDPFNAILDETFSQCSLLFKESPCLLFSRWRHVKVKVKAKKSKSKGSLRD